MSFKYRAITANCGNDAIGSVASQQITDLLIKDEADFFIVNCQETDFNKTKEQLESRTPKGYTIECLSQMATHTKFGTQFHHNTGITSFIIYKKDLIISSIHVVEARREESRLKGGSGYNKGGLVTDFTITGSDGKGIKIQTVSGHLDASKKIKRNQDWHTLYKATLKNVKTWDDLVDACPHLLLSGYDANTRNQLDDEDNEKNMWDSPDDYPEIQALYHASLGGVHYSRQYTYNHVFEPHDVRDPNRLGYAARGMLDFVGVSDGRIGQKEVITNQQVIQIQPENGTRRDHSVIVSPIQDYTLLSPFERVKNQVAARLQGVAPQLACDIRAFKENEKEKLVEIYKDYLNPDGLLDKAIALHTRKLESFNRLNGLLINSSIQQEIADVLFGEWFTGNAKKDRQQQELMRAFLDSLSSCAHESGMGVRLSLYKQLKSKITKNEPINAVDEFKNLAVNHYIKLYNSFAEALEKENKNDFMLDLKERGANILKQLDMIAHHKDLNALKKLDPNKLDMLTHIVERCGDAYEKLERGEKTEPVTEELTQLSHEARGSSSILWQALGDSLDLFVRLISFISRLLSNGETSASAENTSLEIVQDKRLSDSILDYKTALKAMTPQDEDGEQNENEMDLR
ncbi:hypothetical protein Lgra_1727 [Legionella gratiana]|uniref:Uncharacterized protein n=1 Tax=Legionella gratiana TaxID=45066 RepID=A0A378J7X4_9GAMM|nr:hypothetical protein [Legionella gratiana]KTD10761.1 hypothetical protein Lgra_1727 [Legionella gratiana]STX43883.1 Uncharacterised protein [Legionella gratiana]